MTTNTTLAALTLASTLGLVVGSMGAQDRERPQAVAPAPAAEPTGWFVGGTLADLHAGNGKIAAYPPEQYEYGFKYNSEMIHRAVCTKWNLGLRFYNVEPYLVMSDDPSAGCERGGSIFYVGTHAKNDDDATPETWRHAYWWVDHDKGDGNQTQREVVVPGMSNGYTAIDVYVRKI